MVIFLAVISTTVAALGVRELLRRYPPRPSVTLLDIAPVGDWPGLVSLVLPRKIRRLWTGALHILCAACLIALHAFIILELGNGGSPAPVMVALYCASLPLAIAGVLVLLLLWRGRRGAP